MAVRGTRWGKKVPGTPDEAQKLLLEATGRVVERRGVARTTLADIASEAGVTRPTVYKHFDSKEAIIEAYLLSIAGPYVARTITELAGVPSSSRDPRARIVASVSELVRTMPTQPWFGPFFHGESAVFTTTILLQSENLLKTATLLLEPILERAGRKDLPPRAIIELSIRVVLSYALVPAADTNALTEALELVAAALGGPNLAQPAKGILSRSDRTRSRAKGTRGEAG
jgi:AcrR family transcriptional regulator